MSNQKGEEKGEFPMTSVEISNSAKQQWVEGFVGVLTVSETVRWEVAANFPTNVKASWRLDCGS